MIDRAEALTTVAETLARYPGMLELHFQAALVSPDHPNAIPHPLGALAIGLYVGTGDDDRDELVIGYARTGDLWHQMWEALHPAPESPVNSFLIDVTGTVYIWWRGTRCLAT